MSIRFNTGVNINLIPQWLIRQRKDNMSKISETPMVMTLSINIHNLFDLRIYLYPSIFLCHLAGLVELNEN